MNEERRMLRSFLSETDVKAPDVFNRLLKNPPMPPASVLHFGLKSPQEGLFSKAFRF